MVTLWRIVAGAIPTLLAKAGKLMAQCCCSSSGSSSSDSSSSSGSSSGSEPFPGAGWYCVQHWDSAISCRDITCKAADCKYIGTQATWDGYKFAECVTTGSPPMVLYHMSTTNGTLHASEAACHAEACACP